MLKGNVRSVPNEYRYGTDTTCPVTAIEANGYKSNDLIVSFGPKGRSTSADIDICKDVKEYMVRIQQRRLINEILGQREILRKSVFEEQVRPYHNHKNQLH